MATRCRIVLYDDGCPMCTFQMRLIGWLDWFDTVSLMPLSHPRATDLAPSLTPEALREAIHCIAPEGRIYRGARCIRHVALRLPLAMPMALVLWIPGVIWVAERVYQWISRNRHLLSRWFGCREACAILPARKRANDEHPPAK
ncbi:MAG TPA: DUF393 domain-containing protein [Methylomirabilota bacterium]|nr:DUF393 domain-containing protein [Methylomirabilota bacterium]